MPRPSLATVLLVPLLALTLATPAQTITPGPSNVTSLMLALTGIFPYPPNPCVVPGESVSLRGEVHVVTKVMITPGPINFVADIHLNMAGVTGTGQTTGNTYIGTGSSKLVGVLVTPGPSQVTATFALEPTDGCASVPLPVNLILNFGSDGTLLTDGSSATVVGQPPA